MEGIALLKKMVELAENRIEIMAGSGIQANQIEALWNIGIRHFHASAGSAYSSPMNYRNPHIAMGKQGGQDEFLRMEADRNKVKHLLETIAIQASSVKF